MASAPRITDFKDDFGRPDAANPGSRWDGGYSVLSGGFFFDNLKIVSLHTQGTSVSSNALMTVNNMSLPTDHWCESKILTLNASSGVAVLLDLYVRFGTSGPISGYSAQLAVNFGDVAGQKRSQFCEWTDALGDIVIGTPDTTTTWATGDIARCEAIGTDLLLYRNGVLINQTTMTQFGTNTRVGLGTGMSGAASLADGEMDDFTAGHFWAPALRSKRPFPYKPGGHPLMRPTSRRI